MFYITLQFKLYGKFLHVGLQQMLVRTTIILHLTLYFLTCTRGICAKLLGSLTLNHFSIAAMGLIPAVCVLLGEESIQLKLMERQWLLLACNIMHRASPEVFLYQLPLH